MPRVWFLGNGIWEWDMGCGILLQGSSLAQTSTSQHTPPLWGGHCSHSLLTNTLSLALLAELSSPPPLNVTCCPSVSATSIPGSSSASFLTSAFPLFSTPFTCMLGNTPLQTWFLLHYPRVLDVSTQLDGAFLENRAMSHTGFFCIPQQWISSGDNFASRRHWQCLETF